MKKMTYILAAAMLLLLPSCRFIKVDKEMLKDLPNRQAEGCFFLTMQGQCKPNAESSLYAEVQPVLAISIAKLRQEFHRNKKTTDFFIDLLRQKPSFATKEE